jgi:hypothetical protein
MSIDKDQKTQVLISSSRRFEKEKHTCSFVNIYSFHVFSLEYVAGQFCLLKMTKLPTTQALQHQATSREIIV